MNSINNTIDAVEDHKAGAEQCEGDTGKVTDVEATEGQWAEEEISCRMCDPVDEDIGDEAEEEAEMQRPLRDPGMPTRREILEHNLTHIPPRPWCPHCVKGKGKDSPSLRLKGVYAESLVPRVRMDYCFLTENIVETDGEGQVEDDDQEVTGTESGNKQTVLVMQESECRSVWSYAVDKKGASE